jgi:RNA polymerase sigma-70 factor (sigma-E family)
MQTALEATGRHWRRVRGHADPTAYVKRAMVNAHISRWRRLRREWLSDTTPEPAGPASTSGDGDSAAELAVWAAVAALPPRQRAVLVLRYYEDLTEADIADALGCAPGTLKSQASKALARLRRTLGDDLIDAEQEVSHERA